MWCVMIDVRHICKSFGSFKALDDVSFQIEKGEIVGILGQNGSGKTTLMRILTGFFTAEQGQVVVDGQDIRRAVYAIRKKIGYLPENPPLYPSMQVKDYLLLAARLKEVPSRQCQAQVERVLKACHLQDVVHKTIGILSRGYKQRVGLAQAMINEPELLILDEPTNGLDPVQILQIRDLIKNFEYKRTVLLSTHILPEIEQMAQRVLILKCGKVIADELLGNLKADINHCTQILIRVKGQRDALMQAVKESNSLRLLSLESRDGILDVKVENTNQLRNFNELVTKVMGRRGEILAVHPCEKNLERVFLDYHPEGEIYGA